LRGVRGVFLLSSFNIGLDIQNKYNESLNSFLYLPGTKKIINNNVVILGHFKFIAFESGVFVFLTQ